MELPGIYFFLSNYEFSHCVDDVPLGDDDDVIIMKVMRIYYKSRGVEQRGVFIT